MSRFDHEPRIERRRGRARLVAEAMFKDEAVYTLDPPLEGLALWVALIVTADTTGKTEGDPDVIYRTTLANYRGEMSVALIEALLVQMAQRRCKPRPLIKRYQIGNRHHIQLVSWSKVQRFKRPAMPEHPAPPTQPNSELAAVHDAIASVYGKTPRWKYHQIAGKLWASGVRNRFQVLEIIRSLDNAGDRVSNPWAYIRSNGLLATALSKGVEAYAAKEKAAESAEVPQEVSGLIAGMLDKMSEPK